MPRSFVEQACARCSVEGARFWFSCNPEGPAHWFYREWICKAEEIPYMGIETFRFVCTAVMAGRERAFELRYSVRDHRWVLWRFLDRPLS